MKYRIRAHPTTYAGVNFRSRLEARWAAFFNCMKWKWQYEPLDLEGWTPDFRVTLTVDNRMFVFLVEVKPYSHISEFNPHPCMNTDCGNLGSTTAGFGLDPTITIFKKPMMERFRSLYELCYIPDMEASWIAAGNLIQWKKKSRKRAKAGR